jgi:hypothetical protein
MMSTSQDTSQKFHQYNPDDRQLLVGLLHEYSEKLVEASREVIRTRERTSIGEMIIFFPSCLFSYSFSYLFWKVVASYMRTSRELGDFSTDLYMTVSENLFAAIACSTIILLPIVLGLLMKSNLSNLFASFYFSSYDRRRKIESDLRERDARMIANRLESAMRLTVEVADSIETNLARKLELDLRIDDASSALDYYYSVINLKYKSQSKSRKVAS